MSNRRQNSQPTAVFDRQKQELGVEMAEDAPIELEHAIGFSALRGGLHYHNNGREKKARRM